MEMFSLPRGAK